MHVGVSPKSRTIAMQVVRRSYIGSRRRYLAGTVTSGAVCVLPVSVSENSSIRKLNADFER